MTTCEILVIDDNARFPLHVWRYLTRGLGFGIGDVGLQGIWTGSPGNEEPWLHEVSEIGENRGRFLASEDGRYRIWWICADDEAQNKLEKLFHYWFDEQSRIYSLVDVHGKRGSRYRAQEICAWLERRQEGRTGGFDICPVSAYQAGHRLTGVARSFPVLPKSRETLRSMVRELGTRLNATSPSTDVRHVLVTGAGFEIRSERGGFGMPPTCKILWEMGSPFYIPKEKGDLSDSEDLPLVEPEPEKKGGAIPRNAFPVPKGGAFGSYGPRATLSGLAREGNLDSYWDYLLEQEVQRSLSPTPGPATAEQRDQGKAEALWREKCLREAFRRSLLRHDWGFMNQSLHAAQLPLHAWLTTNYTQFADRALSLSGDTGPGQGMWRVISTAAEARTLMREGAGSQDQNSRFLFKLHGDIAHLQTMAIAGHDKDLFSPLSVPMEDLYQVYAAAERFLIDSFYLDPRPSLVVWHIVGHGLQDRRLCELLARAFRHMPNGIDQIFVIVNPQPDGPRDCLKEKLNEARSGGSEAICDCPLRSADYMARLYQLLRGHDPKLPEIRQAGELRQWLEALTLHDSGQSLY